MSRTALTSTVVASGGVVVTAPATTMTLGAGNGVTFNNAVAKTALYIKNGANAAVITIKANQTSDGLVVPDKTVSIAANAAVILNFPTVPYNDASGLVAVDVDVASMTCAAIVLTN